MELVFKFLMVFFATFILDWIWASYIIETSSKNSIKSSLLSGLIVLMGAFITLSYIEDKKMLIAAVAGGALGTFFCVEKSKRDEK